MTVNSPAKVDVEVGAFPSKVEAVVAGSKAWSEGHKDVRLTESKETRGATTVTVSKEFDSPAYWGWLHTQLVARAKWVSERVGIDLTNLKPPVPSAKLSALIDAYTAKPKLSSNEASRSKLFWTEFAKAIDVSTVGEIGHPQIIKYEKAVAAGGLSTKSTHHRFAKVKTVIAYGLKRGLDIEGCRRALDAAAVLDAQHRNENDPTPIEPTAFWKVYSAAMKAGDTVFAALVLIALNACCYGGEAAVLKWGEIDLKAGTLVTRRPKTGVSRVAVLWPETIAALNAVPKRDGVDFIFNTSRRSYTTYSVLEVWRRYCTAAELPTDLKVGQIRDAAYSIACQSATLDQAKALAGHRFPGMTDAYVRRRPYFVGTACEAIRREFEVPKYATAQRTQD